MLVPIVSIAVAACLIMAIRYALYSPQLSNTYLWGVYHVHSSMSDGLKSPKEIALQARASGVGLVLLTDHGSPNLASSSFRETIDGVTIVGARKPACPMVGSLFWARRSCQDSPYHPFRRKRLTTRGSGVRFPYWLTPTIPGIGGVTGTRT